MTIGKFLAYYGLMLAIAGIVFIISLVMALQSQREIEAAEEIRFISQTLANELMESSRGLTHAIQKFAVTGDERFADEFMDILHIRAGKQPRPESRAISPGVMKPLNELLLCANLTDVELALLQHAGQLSDKLVLLELEAMNAVRGLYQDSLGNYTIKGEPDRKKAIELVFSMEYEMETAMIMQPITQFYTILENRLDSDSEKAKARYNRTVLIEWAVLSVVVAIYGIFIYLVRTVIVRPILLCDSFAKRITAGDFDSSLSYTSRNEIGSLADSLRVMLQSLLERIKLQEQAERFGAIVSIADAGIIVKDKFGVVQIWNIGAENILGYKPEEIIGRTTKYYAPAEESTGIDEIEASLRSGAHITHEDVVRKHKDGHLVDCSASYTPIFDTNGNFTGSVAIFHDITDKKQTERDLQDAVRMAKEASKAKSTFLAHMSHEIRTPMNGIIGLSELAGDDNEIPARTRDYLIRINASANGLMDIINDILDISKIEAGKMELEEIPFEINDVILDCESICKPRAIEKGIDLYIRADSKRVVGDPTKLRQILLNLMSNAIKFTDTGSVRLTASCIREESDSVLFYFEVRDTGIGMTQEQIHRIFEPFVQADNSTTRKYGGTGLGLSIAKNMINLMGGDLSAESNPGRGGKFSFSIRMGLDKLGANEVRWYNTAIPVFKGRVLVCEDNSTNQLVIQRHLSKVGLSCTIAENGKVGVELVKSCLAEGNPFDLIFMDVRMPIMDGLEASHRIKGLGNTAPVIALTANVMQTDIENYKNHGMCDCLGKPFSVKELWSCLLKHLIPDRYLPAAAPQTNFNEEVHNEGAYNEGAYNKGSVLDRQSGLSHADGDEKLYIRLLTNFAKDNIDTYKRFSAAIGNGDSKLAGRIAHTLKSVASLIGANTLRKTAADTEKELARGVLSQETALAFESDLKAVLSELTSIVTTADCQPIIKDIEKEKVIELINNLEIMLETGNAKSLHLIPEIDSMSFHFGELFNRLSSQIEVYEFEQAIETLNLIKIQLNSKF